MTTTLITGANKGLGYETVRMAQANSITVDAPLIAVDCTTRRSCPRKRDGRKPTLATI
jgi:NAD(P)-dependent dehydrogenase (short-subunit alcohol dehydrogenase family)